MEVVLRCENYVQVDALTVVDFTMLYVVWLSFESWRHAPVVHRLLAARLLIHLVLISSSAIANHDVIITIRRPDEKRLFCGKQTLRQPRNGVTDWSIAQLLTGNWLVCGEIASNKNSHAWQAVISVIKLLRISRLQKETAVNFLKGNEFKAILPDIKKV